MTEQRDVPEAAIDAFLKGDSGFWTGVGIRECVRMGLAAAMEQVPAAQRHDSDCQAFSNTYAHQGEPGLFPHGPHRNGKTYHADAVGTNGRRILIRDDADGIYVGGAQLNAATALKLAALLSQMATDRWIRETPPVEYKL